MIELDLGVEVGRKTPFELRAWLVLTTNAAWKIEQFLAATGRRFAVGEQLSIDARSCEGKRLCVTLCNRVTDRGGLYPEIMDFRRREDCPRLGAMDAEELYQWGLHADGTRKTLTQVAADALGDSPAPSARQRTKANSYTPQQLPHEDDEEIPF